MIFVNKSHHDRSFYRFCAGVSLLLLVTAQSHESSAFSFGPRARTAKSSSFLALSSSATAPSMLASQQYPRPLHPGGFSLPPLVEDLLPVVTSNSSMNAGDSKIRRINLLLIRPPDPESLWEWYAYTKRKSDSDPSWGRVWPTALSLTRLVIRSLEGNQGVEIVGSSDIAENMQTSEMKMMKQALNSLRSTSHVIELGCGLGVVGLAFACAVTAYSASSDAPSMGFDESTMSSIDSKKYFPRTITFLDREPYALHCVMASASTNGLITAPILPPESTEGHDIATKNNYNTEANGMTVPLITVRAAIDDWAIPRDNGNVESNSHIKNICFEDLHLEQYVNQNTILIASDILYEPYSMSFLASKLQSLLHPNNGGYALIADPEKERTTGCRDSFVKSVKELGGAVVVLPLSQPMQGNMNPGIMDVMMKSWIKSSMIVESDLDIDGSLAKTVLIIVHFNGRNEA